jgi:hypothetical protein
MAPMVENPASNPVGKTEPFENEYLRVMDKQGGLFHAYTEILGISPYPGPFPSIFCEKIGNEVICRA